MLDPEYFMLVEAERKSRFSGDIPKCAEREIQKHPVSGFPFLIIAEASDEKQTSSESMLANSLQPYGNIPMFHRRI
jgi:hypothetical protein